MSNKSSEITKKEASLEYNELVRNFKDLVSALKAILLVHPDETAHLILAKKRITELQDSITNLRKKVMDGNLEGFVESAKVLELEVRIFNELLDKVDDDVRPEHIRLICERLGDSRDDELASLARFYISRKSKTDLNLNKLDFVITEAVTERAGREKFLKTEGEMDRIFADIGISDAEPSEYEQAMLHEFQHASERIEAARSIDEIWDNDIILTMKNFKIEIGENLFSPGIIREAVKYNVCLHNKLLKLYETIDAGIVEAMQGVASVEEDMKRFDQAGRSYAKSALKKAKEIYEGYKEISSNRGRDLTMIIQAAKARKEMSEAVEKAKEIKVAPTKEEKIAQEVKAEEEKKWKPKSVREMMSEVMNDLLRLEGNIAGKRVKTASGFKLSQMSDYDKNLFMMDTDSLSTEDKQIIDHFKETVILSQKLALDYRQAKRNLEQEEIEEFVAGEFDKACSIERALQYNLDTYRSGSKAATRIDILKMKSMISRSVTRLRKIAKDDDIILEEDE